VLDSTSVVSSVKHHDRYLGIVLVVVPFKIGCISVAGSASRKFSRLEKPQLGTQASGTVSRPSDPIESSIRACDKKKAMGLAAGASGDMHVPLTIYELLG
jgi:hypothetical protein